MPPPASTPATTQPPTEPANDSLAPEPRTTIVVTEHSPGLAKITIQARSAGHETVGGEASINAHGMWPELIDRTLEPALIALADAADGDSIALKPSPALAPRCWEGTLYSLVPHAAARLAFHRVLPATQVLRPVPKPARITADGSLRALLANAWKGKPGIVHVIRRFTWTHQGNVSLTTDYGRDVPAPGGQTLTRFDFADAQLLIVQCDPSMAEISTWASASETALAREYVIGALLRASASGLVIPAIPERLLAGFTERLVAGVGGCTRTELIECARALRTYLREHDCAAYELTLFLREDHLD
jgi:hypothetical protein